VITKLENMTQIIIGYIFIELSSVRVTPSLHQTTWEQRRLSRLVWASLITCLPEHKFNKRAPPPYITYMISWNLTRFKENNCLLSFCGKVKRYQEVI